MSGESMKPTPPRGVIEIQTSVFCVRCPICGQKIYGLHDGEVRRALVEHLNKVHCTEVW
jgi:hypothetical protein